MIMTKSRFLFGKDNYVQSRVEKQKRTVNANSCGKREKGKERGSVPSLSLSLSLSKPPPFFWCMCVFEKKN